MSAPWSYDLGPTLYAKEEQEGTLVFLNRQGFNEIRVTIDKLARLVDLYQKQIIKRAKEKALANHPRLPGL